MNRVGEFIRTTLLGGVLVILPVVVTFALLARLLKAVAAILRPIVEGLTADLPLPEIAAALVIILVCFLAGVIVRTGPGRRLKEALDRRFLERIPGYTMIRGLAGRITGQGEGETFAAALVEIEEALVPAFVVEHHPDGRYTVFVPSVPTPAAGAIYILAPERVHLVDVPFTKAVSVISRWGSGTQELLDAMRPPSR